MRFLLLISSPNGQHIWNWAAQSLEPGTSFRYAPPSRLLGQELKHLIYLLLSQEQCEGARLEVEQPYGMLVSQVVTSPAKPSLPISTSRLDLKRPQLQAYSCDGQDLVPIRLLTEGPFLFFPCAYLPKAACNMKSAAIIATKCGREENEHDSKILKPSAEVSAHHFCPVLFHTQRITHGCRSDQGTFYLN